MWTDQISAWSAVITAVFSGVVVIVALVAWRTARQTLHASREANAQAKHDSIEQTRPYVYAEVVPSLLDHRIGTSGSSMLAARQREI